MRRCLVLAALVLLAGPVAADDEKGPISEKPLWFRIVLAREPIREVVGYLDESKGTGNGYDVAVYDKDGDGAPETRGSREIRCHTGPGQVEIRREADLRIEVADCSWQVMFEVSWGGLRDEDDGPTGVAFSWGASVDGGFVHFINGFARTYPNEAAARKAKANRIGPPFHWVVGTGHQGPHALVTAGLDDGCDARLRIGMRGDDDIRATLRILSKEGDAEEVLGDYG